MTSELIDKLRHDAREALTKVLRPMVSLSRGIALPMDREYSGASSSKSVLAMRQESSMISKRARRI